MRQGKRGKINKADLWWGRSASFKRITKVCYSAAVHWSVERCKSARPHSLENGWRKSGHIVSVSVQSKAEGTSVLFNTYIYMCTHKPTQQHFFS